MDETSGGGGAQVRQLRAVREYESFAITRAKLNTTVANKVRALVATMRITETLPADDDVPKFLPPCVSAWLRPIPGTDLLLLYEVEEDGALWLRNIRRFGDRPF